MMKVTRLTPNFRKIRFWLVVLACLIFGIYQAVAGVATDDSSPLVINEIMAANDGGLLDEDGDPSDWIELANRSSLPLNLGGWALTDDANAPAKWPLPDITLPGGGHLVIFASGKNRITNETGRPLHTNFRLDRSGEFLALYNMLDEKMIPLAPQQYSMQLKGVSYGRLALDNQFGYLASPSPGTKNETGSSWQGLVAPVTFSQPHGFYEEPFRLTLSSSTADATIYYTLDGSEPTMEHGKLYSEPINIGQTTLVRAIAFKAGHIPPASTTHSYLFLDDVLHQPAQPPGFPATWGRHPRTIWEFREGEAVVADYEMDPDIANDPAYGPGLKDDLKAIPSLSIVTDMANLDIYANPREQGRAWERQASVELIYPEGEDAGFQVNAGLRIHGGRGREEYIPKHSFRLFFRSEYGTPRLRYPLFPDTPVDSFDTLVLRGGVNRSYAGQIASTKTGFELTTYTRDQWLRESQMEMSGSSAHGIFVHLYLNGLYWGLYNIVERPDAAFMASTFGGDEDSWFAMNANGPLDDAGQVFENIMLELVNVNTLPAEEKYPALQELVDLEQFADYVILNWYSGTRDWPHNNWYAGLQRPSGQIEFFVWDGEVTWVDGARIALGEGDNPAQQFFEAFINYPDFQILFADRLYHHLYHDGALSEANAKERWLRLNSIIERAIVGESARWGDTRYETPITQADWLIARDSVLRQMEGNVSKLISLARAEGYYPATDPPGFNQQGGLVSPEFTLTMQADEPIYYTMDGGDPRLAGTGEVAPGAMLYEGPVTITAATHIKARSRSPDVSMFGQGWSALNGAEFTMVAALPQLQITEIMYNPAGTDEVEFLELKNVGPGNLDLSGMTFTGIRFTFPPGTVLPANEYVVLTNDATAFAGEYPETPIGGVYQGQLANEGETITLTDSAGQTVLTVTYSTRNNWPISADGRGDALHLVAENGDPATPKSWRASPPAPGQ